MFPFASISGIFLPTRHCGDFQFPFSWNSPPCARSHYSFFSPNIERPCLTNHGRPPFPLLSLETSLRTPPGSVLSAYCIKARANIDHDLVFRKVLLPFLTPLSARLPPPLNPSYELHTPGKCRSSSLPPHLEVPAPDLRIPYRLVPSNFADLVFRL